MNISKFANRMERNIRDVRRTIDYFNVIMKDKLENISNETFKNYSSDVIFTK